MSGCAHCVWDDYREDVEQWALQLQDARAKLDAKRAREGGPNYGGMSMDDDGGGSETNWTLPSSSESLFADIPVGIREFMKTEKNLAKKHQKERERERLMA